MPASTIRGTAATTRLRKLECADGCGYIARVSRATMLRGLPGCPCGGTLEPATLEDALAAHAAGVLTDAQLEQHGEYGQWQAELSSVLHGQAGHAQRGHRLAQPEQVAMARIYADRQHVARAAQLKALRDHGYQPVTPTDPMPF